MIAEVLLEKAWIIAAILISYFFIILVFKGKLKGRLFDSPFIFAIIISCFYISSFTLFGISKINPDPDLLEYYYPMASELLSGENPYHNCFLYLGGILWIILMALPLIVWNNPLADAFLIVVLYIVSVFLFYKLSKMLEVDSVKATQIYSLIPLIWQNVRYCQDDALVALIFLAIAILYIKKRNLAATVSGISFYLKYFTMPFYIFMEFGEGDLRRLMKGVVIAIAAFLITSLVLSLAFAENFIALSFRLLSDMPPHGLSYFVILRDIGVDTDLIEIMSFSVFMCLLAFSLYYMRRNAIGLLERSILFFVICFASMYWLTPMYLSWFIAFFVLMYMKNYSLPLLLISFDGAANLWSIAKWDLNCTPLVYVSILVIWTILIKCFIDAVRCSE